MFFFFFFFTIFLPQTFSVSTSVEQECGEWNVLVIHDNPDFTINSFHGNYQQSSPVKTVGKLTWQQPTLPLQGQQLTIIVLNDTSDYYYH